MEGLLGKDLLNLRSSSSSSSNSEVVPGVRVSPSLPLGEECCQLGAKEVWERQAGGK